jgi:transcriptional regulator with XRE-family HTH domain
MLRSTLTTDGARSGCGPLRGQARRKPGQETRKAGRNVATVNPTDLRFILGLKLKSLRQAKNLSLKELSDRSGLSVSYLSEIENGRKYPKPEKLLDLARVLEVAFDELVSLQVSEELGALKAAFSSEFLRGFPFELFGVEPEALFGLVSDEPAKAGALVRAFLEVGRSYDVQVEHFLFAALRSYQQMHGNYFEELEQAALEYRARRGWKFGEGVSAPLLREVLEREYGYEIDEETLADHADLSGLRSVYAEGRPPRLLIHRGLLAAQRAFVFAREIGYRELGLEERAVTSSWIRVRSFEQVLNNFKASYFAGAVLIDREGLKERMTAFLARDRWDGGALLSLMAHLQVTPEMFFYRLTELMPRLFGLDELYFVRFQNRAGTSIFRQSKVFNMSRVPVPHGMGLQEHFCRRWLAIKLLAEFPAQDSSSGSTSLGNAATPEPGTDPGVVGARLGLPLAAGSAGQTLLRAQRSRFVEQDAEFFVISVARPLALNTGMNTSLSMGFLMDERFKRRVRFWNDEAVPRVDVNLTCERCAMTESECVERVAPPTVWLEQQRQRRRDRALAEILSGTTQAQAQGASASHTAPGLSR